MEPLLKQVRELPGKMSALPKGALVLLILGALAVAGGVVALVQAGGGDAYQYAFTNLSPEDSSEAAAVLKSSQIPFRFEAGGGALAVPASKVYDVRLLLASAGLPRGGGVGFELFDRGDLGVSEFTQRINLRRAIEGELARTIGKLSEVRSARVHLSLGEKGLYKEEDRGASAAVVLNLQPGRAPSERSLAGIRHLVASAVPGLRAEAVTVMDGQGAVLSGQSDDGAVGFTRSLEKDLQERVVTVLEPVLGHGAVVARVTATVNSSAVNSTAEVFDGENPALRSERRTAQAQTQESGNLGGVAGAAANQPLVPAVAAAPGNGQKGNSNSQDEVRNYELSRTTTTTVNQTPRLEKLSVAVVVDGVDGKPRAAEELTRLTELVKNAIGFDEERGDKVHVTSAVFTHPPEGAPVEAPKASYPYGLPFPLPLLVAGVGGLLLLLGVGAVFLRRGAQVPVAPPLQLKPGMKVAEIEALAALPPQRAGALPDPSASLQDRARAIAVQDPQRAVHLIRAWMANDGEKEGARG